MGNTSSLPKWIGEDFFPQRFRDDLENVSRARFAVSEGARDVLVFEALVRTGWQEIIWGRRALNEASANGDWQYANRLVSVRPTYLVKALRRGRDAILQRVEPDYVGIAADRLEWAIGEAEATFHAAKAADLGIPTSQWGGDVLNRASAAGDDVRGLAAFLAKPPAPAASSGSVAKPDGWTRTELIAQAQASDAQCSASTFDSIRKAAGIPPAEQGGKGARRRFSNAQLRELITAAEAGKYRTGRTIADAWREPMP